MAAVQAGPDQLLFPFIRNADREDKFGWLQKLFTNTVLFVSAPGGQAIDTADQAKTLSAIGGLAGAPWDKELAARGVTSEDGACVRGAPDLPVGTRGTLRFDGVAVPLPWAARRADADGLHLAFQVDPAAVEAVRQVLQRLAVRQAA